jgi:nitroreductase
MKAGRRSLSSCVCLTVGVAILLFLPSLGQSENAARIKLPPARTEGGKPLMQVLKERRSQRSFSTRELSPESLSGLLWAACGVNRPDARMRTNPTAMNYQEIEVYVAKKDGVFKYEPFTNEIVRVVPEDVRALTGKQAFAAEAPVNLIYVADLSRMTEGSAQEKEALASFDAGFVSENVYLYCASEGLATVVRGWFDRQVIEKALKLSGDRRVLLCQSVGYSKE